MNTMKVYPVAGRLVRHPGTGETVPAAGLIVPRSPYWLRRLACGADYDLDAVLLSGRGKVVRLFGRSVCGNDAHFHLYSH